MRASIALVVALSIVSIALEGSAQSNGINSLARQIGAQEIAVKTDPGKSDGTAWLRLAVLRQDAAQYQESERAYRKAIALLKSGDRAALAEALDHMGTMYVETGRFSKAEPLERKALAAREGRNDFLGIGISHMHLAVLLLGRRELDSAEAEAQMAVSLIAPEHPHPAVQTAATPEEKMSALLDLSLVECARNACATAVPDLKRALDIAHAHYAANSLPVGILDFLLGYALWKSGDERSAADLMRTGMQELETPLGWGHPTYLRVLRQYRTFLSQAGHTTEAAELGERIAKLEGSPGSTQAESSNIPIGLDQLP